MEESSSNLAVLHDQQYLGRVPCANVKEVDGSTMNCDRKASYVCSKCLLVRTVRGHYPQCSKCFGSRDMFGSIASFFVFNSPGLLYDLCVFPQLAPLTPNPA